MSVNSLVCDRGNPRLAVRHLLSEAADSRLPKGFRYASGRAAGIKRLCADKGMRYLDASGQTMHDAATLARIKALVIPPAWADVWF
jgi:DNA topoisomerase-1